MVQGTTMEGDACATTGKNWLIKIVKATVSFNDTVRNPDYVAANLRMNFNSELGKKRKDSAMLNL